MSESQEIIQQIEAVFGNADLPVYVSVISSDAMELFSTKDIPAEEQSANILGIMAFEELTNQLKTRTKKEI